jgi:hypothetical protein
MSMHLASTRHLEPLNQAQAPAPAKWQEEEWGQLDQLLTRDPRRMGYA